MPCPIRETDVPADTDLYPFVRTHAPDRRLINRRQIWAANRFWMEIENMKTGRYGNRGHHHWYVLLSMLKAFNFTLKTCGLHQRGFRNAQNIMLREIPVALPNLPGPFDGFTILHLSDLHLDGMENLTERILAAIDGRAVDLCVFTGDYRTQLHGLNRHIIKRMARIIKSIKSSHGFIGTLGNHDDCHMVNPLENIGLQMLVNETHIIEKEGQKIQFIGTDDVHYYYTDQALHVMETAGRHFSIAMVHSPELYDIASQMGVKLYLCGHTHAGQICLPGGHAILKHLNRGRRFYRGSWRHNNMLGITNSGAGTSGIPIRFNTRSEILLLKLKQAAPGSGPSAEGL